MCASAWHICSEEMALEMRVGERVQLSEIGTSRSPRSRNKKGTVVKTAKSSRDGPIDVLFDGNKRPTRIHSSYVEAIFSRRAFEI
jgi:hypothetical protein